MCLFFSSFFPLLFLFYHAGSFCQLFFFQTLLFANPCHEPQSVDSTTSRPSRLSKPCRFLAASRRGGPLRFSPPGLPSPLRRRATSVLSPLLFDVRKASYPGDHLRSRRVLRDRIGERNAPGWDALTMALVFLSFSRSLSSVLAFALVNLNFFPTVHLSGASLSSSKFPLFLPPNSSSLWLGWGD